MGVYLCAARRSGLALWGVHRVVCCWLGIWEAKKSRNELGVCKGECLAIWRALWCHGGGEMQHTTINWIHKKHKLGLGTSTGTYQMEW